ncbi:MAG: DUF4433 domain-containing protein [Burkholderiales bacterium]|nr:DUF4433 domain-containing protein [Burkholderiales bacterium]
MANISSVMELGIVSYELAAGLPHRSVALQPVQDRRDQKQVPGGLRLHQYANLYFHARNPMMSARRGETPNLGVLRVSTEVLALPGAVISDQNAASNYVRFLHPLQWPLLQFDDIFALDWRHPDDQIRQWRHASRKCAEVLIPQRVESRYLIGAYVVDAEAEARLLDLGCTLPITVNPMLFFR